MVHLDCEELKQGLALKAKTYADLFLKKVINRHHEQNLQWVIFLWHSLPKLPSVFLNALTLMQTKYCCFCSKDLLWIWNHRRESSESSREYRGHDADAWFHTVHKDRGYCRTEWKNKGKLPNDWFYLLYLIHISQEFIDFSHSIPILTSNTTTLCSDRKPTTDWSTSWMSTSLSQRIWSLIQPSFSGPKKFSKPSSWMMRYGSLSAFIAIYHGWVFFTMTWSWASL